MFASLGQLMKSAKKSQAQKCRAKVAGCGKRNEAVEETFGTPKNPDPSLEQDWGLQSPPYNRNLGVIPDS